MNDRGSVELEPKFVPPGYRVQEHLGSGQTSHVYLVTHERLGKVALKLPRPELYYRPVLRRMFENEVQITLSLTNTDNGEPDQHVVRALEGFPTGPEAFLTIEHCPGGTLDEMLGAKQLDFTIASHLILDTAKGLEFSHSRKVLHRDVKPANVFLTETKRAKLGDYGTGLFMTERTEERVGTAFYMAPEIFEGKPPTIQSDVYSLGILAYEVLTGKRPFVGDSYDELMLQHLAGVPQTIQHLRPDATLELSNVVSQAMSRDQSKRFPSVRAFINAYTEVTGIRPMSEVGQPKIGRATRTRTEFTQSPMKPGVDKASEKSEKSKENAGLFGWLKRKK